MKACILNGEVLSPLSLPYRRQPSLHPHDRRLKHPSLENLKGLGRGGGKRTHTHTHTHTHMHTHTHFPKENNTVHNVNLPNHRGCLISLLVIQS